MVVKTRVQSEDGILERGRFKTGTTIWMKLHNNAIWKIKDIFDQYTSVASIGQAFADEIFRVFASDHPELTFMVMNANKDIKQMINRAKSVR